MPEPLDLALVAQRPQPTANTLDSGSFDNLFAHFVQYPDFFNMARNSAAGIDPDQHFDPVVEAQYQFLWCVLCETWDRFHRFTYPALLELAEQVYQRGIVSITEEDYRNVIDPSPQGLIYHCAVSMTQPEMQVCHDLELARAILSDFLYQRRIARPLQSLLTRNMLGVSRDVLQMCMEQAAAEDASIRALTEAPDDFDIMPDLGTEFESPCVWNEIGVPFIDNQIGGQGEGHANGLLGVTGAGKTTLACYMATQSAYTEYHRAREAGRTPRWTVLFTYEQAAKELRPRIISAAADIRRDKLENATDTGCLTTRANLEEYERRLATGNQPVLSETERWQRAQAWLRGSLRVEDMSGADERNPAKGAGFIPEIAARLQSLVQTTERGVVSVIIDWAGLCCARYIEANSLKDEMMRTLLNMFGDRAKREIAMRFKCTAWILHQLRAEAGAYGAGKLLKHTDAMESKAFATHMAFCGCLSVPDPTTGCMRFNWSKTRHRKGQDIRPITLRINDLFGKVDDVTDNYRLDETNGRFVDREAYEAAQGAAQGASQGGTQGSLRRVRQPSNGPPGRLPIDPASRQYMGDL